MQKVIIDQEFWNLFPAAQINILFVDGIDNHDTTLSIVEREKLLTEAMETAKQLYLNDDSFKDNPLIDEWRQIFKQFTTKKGARASIEALLKRVHNGKGVTPVDPLVDLYNFVSIKNGVPVGIEDRDKIAGDLHLGLAHGGESFQPVGAENDDPARENELIYYDNDGAVCRSLNWRDAQRTMLTADSKKIVAVMEAINDDQITRTNDAMKQLANLIEKYFGIKPTGIFQLTKDNPVATIE
ncbi:B3/4 domain-containing protein [Limosilactobacillus equigenerosi]|uniref:B3 4 domain protein n=1 Tax=Limosilactobacillus equigenerosi DSM 18793 = JCM 14505 TaxID=1423742 RepID=A0A0R1USE1_9LACO|nr:phenylalanine--tRNA ligase beta subunit-related protein [Limosilactobacillus equigenerosi]KRL96070.1 B3 4 domain protein [Limosilactobacillus equigenerosi DSM 18793 = JCM 14505]